MSDIIVTTHDALGNDHKGTRQRLNGKSVPYGFAGYVPQDCGFALCQECVDDERVAEEEERGGMFHGGGLIRGNSETDYPGTVCEDCGEYLNTRLLVYKSHDPQLYEKLTDNE